MLMEGEFAVCEVARVLWERGVEAAERVLVLLLLLLDREWVRGIGESGGVGGRFWGRGGTGEPKVE